MSDDEWAEPNEPDGQEPPAEFAQGQQVAPIEEVTAGTAEDEPELMFPNVEVFVREHLSIIYSRDVGPGTQYRWSAKWWRYAEAISRLESIWRA